jgi:hypothetical protein
VVASHDYFLIKTLYAFLSFLLSELHVRPIVTLLTLLS